MSYLKRRESSEYYFCEHTSWSSPQDFNPLGSQTQFAPPRPLEFASRYRNRENGWNNNGTDNTAIVAGITARNHRPRGSCSARAGRLHESYITSAVCPLGIGNRVENELRRYYYRCTTRRYKNEKRCASMCNSNTRSLYVKYRVCRARVKTARRIQWWFIAKTSTFCEVFGAETFMHRYRDVRLLVLL